MHSSARPRSCASLLLEGEGVRLVPRHGSRLQYRTADNLAALCCRKGAHAVGARTALGRTRCEADLLELDGWLWLTATQSRLASNTLTGCVSVTISFNVRFADSRVATRAQIAGASVASRYWLRIACCTRFGYKELSPCLRTVSSQF